MKDKIIEMYKEGKGIMEIARILNISHSYVSKIVSDGFNEVTESTDLVTDSSDGCKLGKDKLDCEQYQELNEVSVRKLRPCDYTKDELLENPNAPYFNCS
jgi:hypothetical protein